MFLQSTEHDTPTNIKNIVKITEGVRPCKAFVLRNWVKFQFWRFQTPPLHRRGRNMARRSPPKFRIHRCNLSPLRGEKPQNRPISNRK